MADIQLTCRTCGAQFTYSTKRGRRPHWCSPECKRGLATRGPRGCATCGKVFGPSSHADQRYCSRSCWPSQAASQVKGYTYDCAVCGKTYAPKKKDRATTCSRECGREWSSIKAAAQRNGLRIWVAVKVPTASSRRSTVPRCRVCSGPIGVTETIASAQGACSSDCMTALMVRRWHPDRRTRAARERAVRVETVHPLRVFERDGWVCRACGRKAPQRLRGTYDPRAPELDHIVPISKGGEHSYRNTQLLCRGCNIAKSDTIAGQMLLFG